MAHVDVMKTYRVNLTPEEFKLVCMGLIAMNTTESLALNHQLASLAHKQQELASEISRQAAVGASCLVERGPADG